MTDESTADANARAAADRVIAGRTPFQMMHDEQQDALAASDDPVWMLVDRAGSVMALTAAGRYRVERRPVDNDGYLELPEACIVVALDSPWSITVLTPVEPAE